MKVDVTVVSVVDVRDVMLTAAGRVVDWVVAGLVGLRAF